MYRCCASRMFLGVYFASAAVACVGVITYCCPSCLFIESLGVLTGLGVVVSVISVVWVHILLSSPHKTGMGIEYACKDQEIFRNKLMVRPGCRSQQMCHSRLLQKDFDNTHSQKSPQNHLPVIFGRTVDSLLQQLLDYVIRDFVTFYLKNYAYEPNVICDNIK